MTKNNCLLYSIFYLFVCTLAYGFLLLKYSILKDNVNSEDMDEDTQKEDYVAQGFSKDDKIELEDNNVNNLSGEDKDDPCTSNSCKLSLSKVRIS